MCPRAMQEFDLLGPLAERGTKKKPRSALGCRSACLLCTLYSRFGVSLCLVALVHVAILPLKIAVICREIYPSQYVGLPV